MSADDTRMSPETQSVHRFGGCTGEPRPPGLEREEREVGEGRWRDER